MPGISDPGMALSAAAIAAGIPVIPIPGANAALSALVASGLPTTAFQFLGFLPEKAGQRRTRIESLADDDSERTLVFYEAPHRILETLADFEAVFGSQLRVVMARELTKIHEEFLRGPVAQVRADMQARDRVRGEITLIVLAPARSSAPSETIGVTIAQRVALLQSEFSIDEKEALKRLARELNRSKSEIYRELQRERAARSKRA